MKKILVIGCPGSGKSTFARALAERIGLPLYHLDMMYWNADRTQVEKTVFRAKLAETLSRDQWIIDGNYQSTMELRLQAADTVFFLDYPTEVCLEGLRERRGKPRPDMPWIEQEEDTELTEYVRSFVEKNRPLILTLLKKYASLSTVVLTDRALADAYLKSLSQKEF